LQLEQGGGQLHTHQPVPACASCHHRYLQQQPLLPLFLPLPLPLHLLLLLLLPCLLLPLLLLLLLPLLPHLLLPRLPHLLLPLLPHLPLPLLLLLPPLLWPPQGCVGTASVHHPMGAAACCAVGSAAGV
jgi:hypothetical protein